MIVSKGALIAPVKLYPKIASTTKSNLVWKSEGRASKIGIS